MGMRTSAAAEELVEGVRTLADIVYVPMRDSVARMEWTDRGWVLYIDTDSSHEDRCWAMAGVLRLLTSRSAEPVCTIPRQGIRLVR
ncbi:hypothetical protein GCM10017691_06140 [Pseudonocardia petroleophila]